MHAAIIRTSIFNLELAQRLDAIFLKEYGGKLCLVANESESIRTERVI